MQSGIGGDPGDAVKQQFRGASGRVRVERSCIALRTAEDQDVPHAIECSDQRACRGQAGCGRDHAVWRGARGAAVPVQVHTKYVPDLDRLPAHSRVDVVRGVDRSLARLGVDSLDLVQLHWWDYEVPGYVEAAAWLDELRRAGRIRHVGLTNFDQKRLKEIVAAGIPVVSHQVQYSVLDRRPANGIAAQCARDGIGLLCYGALAGGFLSDRYLGRPDPASPLENRSLGLARSASRTGLLVRHRRARPALPLPSATRLA